MALLFCCCQSDDTSRGVVNILAGLLENDFYLFFLQK